jgi:hypothetical protein
VLRVDADLVSPVQPAPRRVTGSGSLSQAEEPLQSDPSSLVLLVLWGQLLLAAAVGCTWLHRRWGRWQTWTVGAPLIGLLGLQVADQSIRLLPNLL